MKTAIHVEGLSKRYRVHHEGQSAGYRTLGETLTQLAGAPLRRLRSGPQARASDEDFWALRDVNFEVPAGEAVGIIGRNGAGKSTLLKILSRITKPTTGTVELRGRVGSLLEVGTGFHPELTGRENIYLNGSILGMSRRDIARRFDEIVAFSEVERFLDTPVKRYSSGMYVRLAFAVAAHLEPEILVVDEVLAVGDAGFQKKCLGKMQDVSEGGRTVLFVSHNMAAVSQLCNSAVWLESGRVERLGPASDIVKDYLAKASVRVAERRWSYPGDAPGDDRIRLLGCRVVQDGEVAPVVDINVPSRVELDFQVLREARDLIAGINLYDATGQCLFATCDWQPNRLAPGCYTKHVDIPAQLLAEGPTDVLVQLVFYDPDVRSVVEPNALAFDAIESDHPDAVRGYYKGTWPGAVRIALPWSPSHAL